MFINNVTNFPYFSNLISSFGNKEQGNKIILCLIFSGLAKLFALSRLGILVI